MSSPGSALRNLGEDLEDLGSRFDGAQDLQLRLASEALELEQSGLGGSSPRAKTGRAVTRRLSIPPQVHDLDFAQEVCIADSLKKSDGVRPPTRSLQ
jgi:hypothetical protein